MTPKEERALRLYGALSEIDDALLVSVTQEQREGAVHQRGLLRRNLLRYGTVAAALLLVIALGASGILSSILGSGNTAPPDSGAKPTTLDALLLSHIGEMTVHEEMPPVSAGQGSAMLICQMREGGEYYTLSLPDRASALMDELSGAHLTADEAGKITYRVWIRETDGTVFSPHLSPAPGNLSIGRLMDYSPEILPSQQFLDALARLL